MSHDARRRAAEKRFNAWGQLTEDPHQPALRSWGKTGKRNEIPLEVGRSRQVGTGMPAKLRAKLVQRNGTDMYRLTGIASVTDTPYEMYDLFGAYNEIVDGNAFATTLLSNPDVAFLVNHRGLSMARTIPGLSGGDPSLELSMDEWGGVYGLKSDAWVNPKRSDVSDLVVAIDDGTITEMSFAFHLLEGWWSDDFETFKITEVDLDRGDVSAVNYGANPYTTIGARAKELMADVDRMPTELARDVYDKLGRRTDIYDPAAQAVRQGGPTGRTVAHIEALLEQKVS